jgi:hypothetical protein
MSDPKPLIPVETMVKLEAAKLPLVPVSQQTVAEMGALVAAVQVLVARKRDLGDTMMAMQKVMAQATVLGEKVPQAVLTHEQAFADAARTLDRELGGNDEDEE